MHNSTLDSLAPQVHLAEGFSALQREEKDQACISPSFVRAPKEEEGPACAQMIFVALLHFG